LARTCHRVGWAWRRSVRSKDTQCEGVEERFRETHRQSRARRSGGPWPSWEPRSRRRDFGGAPRRAATRGGRAGGRRGGGRALCGLIPTATSLGAARTPPPGGRKQRALECPGPTTHSYPPPHPRSYHGRFAVCCLRPPPAGPRPWKSTARRAGEAWREGTAAPRRGNEAVWPARDWRR
jgi:hypothetical protein